MRAPRDVFCVHALNRAFDRWGFVPTVAEAVAVHEAITARRATLLRRSPCGRQMWLVALRGQDRRVIFEPSNGAIVTVMEADGGGLVAARTARVRASTSFPPAYRNGKRLQRKTFWRQS